jgi:tartrate-resistant acid phosphatase type 5
MTFGRWVGASIPRGPGLLLSAALSVRLLTACEDSRLAPKPGPEGRNVAKPAPVFTAAPSSVPNAPSADATAPSARMDEQQPPVYGAGGGSQSPSAPGTVRFAVIGDYGWPGSAEREVAELVAGLQPDFVITTGDNNYPSGSAETIDENIGQYYSDFIYPYKGGYASSATVNRFFPTLGNHDWGTPGVQPYLDYFTLPGNERYYDIVRGNVHFFAIDSDVHEPDGIGESSIQAQWLKKQLAASTSAFDVVAMHHPPYSSGPHGNTEPLQWPYAAWGAELVFAGHDHCYERLEIDGITYVVSGLGGRSIYSFGAPVAGSQVRYNDTYGVTLVEASSSELNLTFVTIDGDLIDTKKISAR